MKNLVFVLALMFSFSTFAQKVEVKTETYGNVTKFDIYAQANNDIYDIKEIVKLDEQREQWVFQTMISKYDFLNENQYAYSKEELKIKAKEFCVKLPRIFTEDEMGAIKKANLEVYTRVFE